MKLLVTGAAGWIGRGVAAKAKSMGLEIVALDTVPPAEGPWAAYRVGDIASERVLSLASDPVLDGAVAIIHCAGYAHRPQETPVETALFQAINRDGTSRILELARRVGIGRVVYLSSIAFYDWSQGCDFDEEGPLAAPTAYAETKLAGEQIVRSSGLDWRVARLGTVFGDGDRANFAKLATAIARQRFVVPGLGNARKSVLPVALAAELLVDLALRESISHRLINLALPIAPTLSEICVAFTRVCGFPRVKRMPLGLLRVLAQVGNGIAWLQPGFPLTSLNVRKLTTSTTVRTARMMSVWPGRDWGTLETWLRQGSNYYRRIAAFPNA